MSGAIKFLKSSGLIEKGEKMKIWIRAGVIIFYVLGYFLLKKCMRRDVIKLFKAYMLLMIFLLSLLPESFVLKYLGMALRADTLILWMAGIEAADAWDEYKKEKNKRNYKNGVKKNKKNEEENGV